MKASTKAILDCMLEMEARTKNSGSITGIVELIKFYNGASPKIAKVLVELGYLDREGSNRNAVYKWTMATPTETLALKVGDLCKQIQSKKPVSTISEVRTVVDNVDSIIDRCFKGIELANKYHIPEEMQKQFVKDMFFTKKS